MSLEFSKSNGHNLSMRHENFCGQCYFSHSTPELKMHWTQSEATQSHLQTIPECRKQMTNLLLSSVPCGYNPLTPQKFHRIADGLPLSFNKTCSLYTAQLCIEFGDDSIPQICAVLTSEKAKWSHYGPLPPNCWKCSKSTIHEWTQHSSNCVMVPHTILASHTPIKATFKIASTVHNATPQLSIHYTSVHQ